MKELDLDNSQDANNVINSIIYNSEIDFKTPLNNQSKQDGLQVINKNNMENNVIQEEGDLEVYSPGRIKRNEVVNTQKYNNLPLQEANGTAANGEQSGFYNLNPNA